MNEFISATMNANVSAFYFSIFALAQIVTNVIHWSRLRRLERDFDLLENDYLKRIMMMDHTNER